MATLCRSMAAFRVSNSCSSAISREPCVPSSSSSFSSLSSVDAEDTECGASKVLRFLGLRAKLARADDGGEARADEVARDDGLSARDDDGPPGRDDDGLPARVDEAARAPPRAPIPPPMRER